MPKQLAEAQTKLETVERQLETAKVEVAKPFAQETELSDLRGQTQGQTLEANFMKFNIDHPADYRGHSLFVSDIVVMHENGENNAHFVDSFGFTGLPDFMRELEGRKAHDIEKTELKNYPAVYRIQQVTLWKWMLTHRKRRRAKKRWLTVR